MDIRHITNRLWLYGPGEWDGAWISRSGDEYGRNTLALRLPGERALVWAYRTRHCEECDEMRQQTERAEQDTLRDGVRYMVDRYGSPAPAV